ncbi:hypothetical protein ABPG77_009502 [Micractinium sp. CCAP 211/92]
MRRPLSLLLLSALVAMSSGQGTQEDPKAGKLSVTGTGNVEVVPDVAKVYLAVSVTRPTANAACQQAADTTTKVRDALEAINGIAADDVTTENYSVQPNYVYNPDTQDQKISGYTCQQSLVVKIDDVNNTILAAVIDAAVTSGGNDLQVSQVVMDLSPQLRRSATNQAREAAVEDATEVAQLLAKTAKVTLGAIKTIVDQNTAPPPPNPMPAGGAAAAMEAAKSTPVQIGTTTVAASVAIDWAIADA